MERTSQFISSRELFLPLVLPLVENGILLRMGPSFNNATFIKSFAGAFLDMAKSGNPNIKSDPANITPQWPLWSRNNQQEMLFNRTSAGLVDIRKFPTNESLVERCKCVQVLLACRKNSFEYNAVSGKA